MSSGDPLERKDENGSRREIERVESRFQSAASSRPRGGSSRSAEDLTRVLDEAGVLYELLPHVHTESAAAEAEALELATGDVAKTLIVKTPDGYVRAVLPATERLDLRKLRELLDAGKHEVHLASEEDLGRDFLEFELDDLQRVFPRLEL